MNSTYWLNVSKKLKDESSKYEKYHDVIESMDNAFKKIMTGKSYVKLTEEKLNEYIRDVKEKLEIVKDDELLAILNKEVEKLQKKVDEKWRYRLIDLLSELRKERGLSLTELSSRCNISVSYLSRLEKFERWKISLDKLKIIADTLEVDMNLLISKAMEKKEIENQDIIPEAKTLEELIMNSIIIDDNKKILKSKEKENLLKYINKINLVEYDKEMKFESIINLVEAFKEYKKN